MVNFDAVNSYLTSDGSIKEFDIMPEQLNWSVIYGSPLIDFSAGKVYAKAPGDVVIKAGTLSAGFKKDEEDEITRAEFIKLAVAAMRLNPDDYKNVELPFADAQNIPS